MNDKKDGNSHKPQSPAQNNRVDDARKGSSDYAERGGNKVTNTFSPPTRPDKGGNNGGKSDS